MICNGNLGLESQQRFGNSMCWSHVNWLDGILPVSMEVRKSLLVGPSLLWSVEPRIIIIVAIIITIIIINSEA